jgi:cytochrome c-type biogenesis protein CcmH
MRPNSSSWPAAARRAALAALALMLLAAPLTVSGDNLDDAVRRIAKQLRCPICESVSVADSPAELAGQMRALIRKKLEAGESDQQILDYFVAAYGESVLLEPPRRGLGWAIWLAPIAVLAGGALILLLVVRVWVRHGSGRPVSAPLPSEPGGQPAGEHAIGTAASEGDNPYTERARQELEAIRKAAAG